MNKAIICGNLGRDVELRHTNSGTPVAEVSIATTRKWGDNEETQWHRVIVWADSGANFARLLGKGDKVLIEGRIQYRDYEDRDGNKRTSTEIVCERWEICERRSDRGSSPGPRQEPPQSFGDDGIPF